MPLRRNLLAFALALLLLGLQHQGYVHAITHLGPKHETGLTAPAAAEACAQCALLASGTDGVPSSFVPAFAVGTPSGHAIVRFASRPVAAPAVYASRAPPVLP
jgi:hypothetical protein